MSSVEQIKERLKIEDVVGSYLKLERAGANLKARCPFHNEKTASFFVSPDRGSFYCFGCGAKGDIFTFVERFESLDFPGALKVLADRAGVVLEKFGPKIQDKKERLYALLEEATKFFEKNLAGEEIPTEYLKNRGLSEKTIRDWRIGYVRDEWRTAYDHLKSKGFSDDEMERAGMIKTEKGSTYDRFRGRIMFPIRDGAGRVVAFSGRILRGDDTAKYLNSPQTELFDKSKILYGYDMAKQSIRRFDFSILVEGQFDEIMCQQAGFTNTVASSGTALTRDHLGLLKRISNKIIMSFDADNAGAKAAERAWALALSVGMDVKIAEIPEGYDPADLILKDKEKFKETLKNSKHLIDFLLDKAVVEIKDAKRLWTHIKMKILPYIYLLESSSEQSRYVSRIAELINVKEDFIWDDLKKVKLDEEFQFEKEEDSKAIEQALSGEILKKGSEERILAGIILWKNNPHDLKEKIKDSIGAELFKKFEDEMDKASNELIFEAESYYGGFDEKKLEKEIRYLLLALQEDKIKEEALQIAKEITRDANEEKRKALLIRHTELMKRLEKIKKEKVEFNK
jgi:DNA primase